MLLNYLKIAFRNLWNTKLFTAINCISLAIGLSASFVIGILVYYDFTFDTFHEDGDQIYRITSEFTTPETTFRNSGVPVPLAMETQKGLKGVEVASYFYKSYMSSVTSTQQETRFYNIDAVIFTDKDYFKLFKYNWLAGVATGVLQNPNEVVLTERRAQKYFPNTPLDQIIGKTLVYNESIPVEVTGIVANFTQRTDLIFEEFISLKTAIQSGHKERVLSEHWDGTSSSAQLLVKVDKNTTSQAVKAQLDAISVQHIDEKLSAYNQEQRFNLQPLHDIHFNASYATFTPSGKTANKSSLIGLAGIAAFILLLGCINFINLNTAQATKRAKEIGVRKTLGATKKQVIIQMLGEMFLLTCIATVLSIFFASWLLYVFKDFIPAGVTYTLFADPIIIGFIILLFIVVTLLSGFYPAMILSNFRPHTILKNKATSSKQSVTLRKYLTVFQFSIAQIFILGTLLVGKQLHFLMTKEMGFKTDAIAYVTLPGSNLSIDQSMRFAKELKEIPEIQEVSLGYQPPASNNTSTGHITYHNEGEEIRTDVQFLYGDTYYMNLYDISIIAGRERLNDTIAEYVINESYMKTLGFQNPKDAIGEFVKNDSKQIPIVGVVKDFNQHSLKYSVNPMIITGDLYRSEFPQFRSVHFSLSSHKEGWESAFAKAETAYKNIYPKRDFRLRFVDNTIANFYNEERKMSTLLNWAMGLSILISCLGLLGLVIHTTQIRTKEIGIRKVLGQKSRQITLLLSKEFMVLIIISILIGMPIAYIFFNDWLSTFSYKVPIEISYFMLAGGITLMVALVTISGQTILASKRNPTLSLKEE